MKLTGPEVAKPGILYGVSSQCPQGRGTYAFPHLDTDPCHNRPTCCIWAA